MNPMSVMMLIPAFQDGANAAAGAAQQGLNSVPEAEAGMNGWMVLLVILLVLVLPFVLGQLIANALKMKDLGLKIGILLFALTLGLSPFVDVIAHGQPWTSALEYGIDLAGGTNMVFEVDAERVESLGKTLDAETMDKMVGAIGRRINPSGTEEVTVRLIPPDRIEVIVPGADPQKVERIKKQIVTLGSLEFGLLANRFENPDLIAEAEQMPPDEHLLMRNGQLVAKWRPVGRDPRTGKLKDVDTGNGVATRKGPDGRPEFLVVVNPDPKQRITGELLTRAFEEFAPNGSLAVGFQFNQQGAYLFQQLTARHAPKPGQGYKSRLAILLNDEIHSAPVINEMISGRGQITGQFTEEEVNELVTVLNAGALDLPLKEKPISEFTVSPLLGIDVQEKGKTAIISGAIAVFVFMLAYYWIAGAIADFCLLVNLVLVVGIMALIDATFTLPGLAGLVLTIGMAVDANVLIFERIREEQDKGSSLRLSIQNGFGKALSTIVDANVTTLITAVVLYIIGTDQVKGFAVTLFIGIVMSMYSAVTVGRLAFDIIERKRLLKRINMYGIVRGANWNFVGKKRIAAACSGLLIVGGMATVFVRGSENLDIDFRGGAMVTFRFTENNEPTVDQVDAALAEPFKDTSWSLERLEVAEGPEKKDVMFRLRTTDKDEQSVSNKINEAFASSPFDLVRQHMNSGTPVVIPMAEAGENGETSNADEFAGGHEVEITVKEPMAPATLAGVAADALDELSEGGESKYSEASQLIDVKGNGPAGDVKFTSFQLRVKPDVDEADLTAALSKMKHNMEDQPLFEEKNTFDAAVAGETKMAALGAMLVSLAAIVGYLWFRFHGITFGLAAVAALVHDVLCVLGLVAIGAYLSKEPLVASLLDLDDFKINLPIVAAFLTIIGYSLNDTIVVFDRIREVRGKNPALTDDMVNLSLNQTLSRTLLTSFTTLLVVLILYAIGGEGIHGFAYCLLLGIIVGTYSSIYVASPVLVWLMNRGNGAKPTVRAA